MSDFLWEMGCEEIPARMQRAARETLERLVMQYGKDHLIFFESLHTYVSPRRLTLRLHRVAPVKGIPEVKRGPLVDLGPVAFEGFCRTWSLNPADCTQVSTPKGLVWSASVSPKEQPLEIQLVDMCTKVLNTMFWPKRMRWNSQVTWIRPLRWMVTLLGERILDWTWNGITAGAWSEAHRLAPHGEFFHTPMDMVHQKSSISRFGMTIKSPKTYVVQLAHSGVLVEEEGRQDRIAHDVKSLAASVGGIPYGDTFEALVEENAGLTQWPKAILCGFDGSFLHLPREVIVTTLQVHQKCFCLQSPEGSDLLPYFIMIADGPVSEECVREGYERVVRARLSDALFFWTQDLKIPLRGRLDSLKNRGFFQDLGTLYHKVERLRIFMERLSQEGREFSREGLGGMEKEGAPSSTGSPSHAQGPSPWESRENLGDALVDWRALAEEVAILCKGDLMTAMVGEFPTLQGIMGRHYAKAQGVDSRVAHALQEAYLYPRGSISRGKECGVLSAWLCIVDGMDTLVGFFALGRMPSGSKDPMALRRSCQGVIKAMVAHGVSLDLSLWIDFVLKTYQGQGFLLQDLSGDLRDRILSFFHDRLGHLLREEGVVRDPSAMKNLLRGKDMAHIWHCAEQGAMLQREHPEFLSAYLRVHALIKQMEAHPGEVGKVPEIKKIHGGEKPEAEDFKSRRISLTSVLQHPLERELLHLLDRPLEAHSLGDLLPPWTRAIHGFLDGLRVQEESFVLARIELLRWVEEYFRPLGALPYALIM